MQEQIYDVIILGGGPSGLTAAIYTARAYLKTLVIAGTEAGGQLLKTTEVENFPAFPKGITGPELISNMRSQAEKFEAEFVNEDAIEITGSFEENFKIKTNSGSEFKSKSIIVATGASAKWLGLESEQKLRGKGVSACATCDAFFFKDKEVAVVGAGDVAMEDATFLTKFASKVHILVRKDKDNMRASKIMQERALDNPKIDFHFNTEVKEVLGTDFVTGLTVFNNQTNEESTLDVQGLFVAIGHKPNTDFLKDFVDLDKKGYVALQNSASTSKEGVFVSGDVADYVYRQAITAAGFGCMAALDATRFLESKGVETRVQEY